MKISRKRDREISEFIQESETALRKKAYREEWLGKICIGTSVILLCIFSGLDIWQSVIVGTLLTIGMAAYFSSCVMEIQTSMKSILIALSNAWLEDDEKIK